MKKLFVLCTRSISNEYISHLFKYKQKTMKGVSAIFSFFVNIKFINDCFSVHQKRQPMKEKINIKSF